MRTMRIWNKYHSLGTLEVEISLQMCRFMSESIERITSKRENSREHIYILSYLIKPSDHVLNKELLSFT